MNTAENLPHRSRTSYISGIMESYNFSLLCWSISLSTMSLRFFHVAPCIRISFLLIFHSVCVCVFYGMFLPLRQHLWARVLEMGVGTMANLSLIDIPALGAEYSLWWEKQHEVPFPVWNMPHKRDETDQRCNILRTPCPRLEPSFRDWGLGRRRKPTSQLHLPET